MHANRWKSGIKPIAHNSAVNMARFAPKEAQTERNLRKQKKAFLTTMAAPVGCVKPAGGMQLSISGTS